MRTLLPLLLLLLVTAAQAQTKPPAASQPAKPAPTAKSAPRTPVIASPRNTHAEKPKARSPAQASAGTKPAGKTSAKSQPAKPELPAAPAIAVPEPPPLNPAKGSVTGQDLPRWASLRSETVNLRLGPGTSFQIDWVYHRRDLPVQIEREFEVWRLVEDQDGVKGWVHSANLTGRRNFVVKDAERVLRGSPADDAAPVARLKPGVIGRIRSCEANAAWCEVQVGDYRGFLRRTEFWGTFPTEAVN